jgi:hypothetical protein
MSLVAEVTPEIVKSAGRVAAGVELRNIFLLEGRAALAPQFVEEGCQFPKKGWSIQVGHSGKFTIQRKKTLRTTLQFNFRASETKSKGKPLLVIAATFIAEYEMAEGFSPSTEDLNSFVHANAVFNCWPYWREYVHSTAARMNLPPLTLPFFRVRTPQVENKRLESGAGLAKEIDAQR